MGAFFNSTFFPESLFYVKQISNKSGWPYLSKSESKFGAKVKVYVDFEFRFYMYIVCILYYAQSIFTVCNQKQTARIFVEKEQLIFQRYP